MPPLDEAALLDFTGHARLSGKRTLLTSSPAAYCTDRSLSRPALKPAVAEHDCSGLHD